SSARPARHPAARPRLAVAQARLPRHAAARPAGAARGSRRDSLLPGDRRRHVLRRGAVTQCRRGDLSVAADTGPRHVALVTGAAQGLGYATALRLAADGFAVAVNDISDDGRIASLADQIGGLAVPGDIADPDAVLAMTPAVALQFGGGGVAVGNPAALGVGAVLKPGPPPRGGHGGGEFSRPFPLSPGGGA